MRIRISQFTTGRVNKAVLNYAKINLGDTNPPGDPVAQQSISGYRRRYTSNAVIKPKTAQKPKKFIDLLPSFEISSTLSNFGIGKLDGEIEKKLNSNTSVRINDRSTGSFDFESTPLLDKKRDSTNSDLNKNYDCSPLLFRYGHKKKHNKITSYWKKNYVKNIAPVKTLYIENKDMEWSDSDIPIPQVKNPNETLRNFRKAAYPGKSYGLKTPSESE